MKNMLAPAKSSELLSGRGYEGSKVHARVIFDNFTNFPFLHKLTMLPLNQILGQLSVKCEAESLDSLLSTV